MSESSPRVRPTAQIAAAELPGLNGLMTLAVGVVVIAALYVAREVLIPITLAVLLSFVLAPLVGLLRRIRLGRAPAVVLAVLFALGVIALLSGIIGSQVAQLASDIPRYTTTIEGKINTLRSFTGGHFFEVLGGLGRRIEQASTETTQAKPDVEQVTQPTRPSPLPVELHQPPSSPVELGERILTPILGPLATAAIVFIVAIFILLQQEDLRDRLIRLFGADDLHRATSALDDAARRLSKYFLTQLALNAAFGIIIGVGLLVIGVPNPILWAILAALCRFVPYVGSLLSAGLPLILAASVDPGWSMLLWTAVLYLVAEPVMGQVVEPLVYGNSTGLSPVSVVVSAIFWGWLWGPIGLILSMPLTLCLVVLGRHVKRLEFIDVVLGDRPALTPIESFYQRMLAGDPDEAQDYAEILLRDRSLSSYYDEVAVKGLLLATNDAQRGVLTPMQLDRIENALEELVGELAEHDDVDPNSDQSDDGPVAPPARERDLPKRPAPSIDALDLENLLPPWSSEAPILCVVGRGPFDRAAAMMLAQLLGRHGLKTRIVSYEDATRSTIGSLNISMVAMICVCYLEISGNASHLRYLLRRLRHRLPDAPTLISVWPSDTTVHDDERLKAAIGADFFATSLYSAVTTCLDVARNEGISAANAAA